MSEKRHTFNFDKYRHEKLKVEDLPKLFRNAAEENFELDNNGAGVAFSDAAVIVEVVVDNEKD